MELLEITPSNPVDLSAVDRELIHIPGYVQAHGVLLVLGEPDLQILQVSDNAEMVLGISTSRLLGKPLERLLPSPAVKEVANYLLQATTVAVSPFEVTIPVKYRTPSGKKRHQAKVFKAILHRSQGMAVLELEPRLVGESRNPLEFYHLLRNAIARLRGTSSIGELVQTLAAEVQALTGFDRVMVYRFDPDASGVVVAEVRQEELESYLGLHYPATDVPLPARTLFGQNWLRLIPDVHAQPAQLLPTQHPETHQPLDLSSAVLRGVSPCHLQYLKNMGVAASMTISLINEKHLWGLIACHHYTPRFIDYEVRKACEFLGQFASIELVHQEDLELSQYRKQVKFIQSQLRQSFALEVGCIENVLMRNQAELLDLIHAEGVAILLDGQLTLIGQTPSREEIQELSNWLLEHQRQEVFVTDCLSSHYPPARSFKDSASGVLAISIFLQQQSYHLFWFRPEQIQTIDWAGNPYHAVLPGPGATMPLSPRQSFELWKETVQERSIAWTHAEKEAALEMRNSLMLAVLEFSQVALEQTAERAAIANRAKSQFLAKMSHELRTPLNAILGFAHLMYRDISLPEPLRAHLAIISRSGEHLLALINDVLEMSRIEAGRLTLVESCFDLYRFLRSIQEMFVLKAVEKGLDLRVEHAPSLPQYVRGDEGKLRQILINLIGNAVKFTAVGHVMVRVKQDGNMLVFAVEDTGAGLSAEDLETIFEAFIQTERGRHMQGTGLGLSISRQFARLMGGDVTVRSLVGRGSTFTCQIPMIPAEELGILATESTRLVVGLEPGQPDYRILVAEDVPENRELLIKILTNVGFEVQTAETGQQVIDLWQEWQPHLIWMDMQMPEMDGYEATRCIRERERLKRQGFLIDNPQTTWDTVSDTAACPPTIIIALTAGAFEFDRQACLQVGCDDYVAKPFTETVLFEKMGRYLGLHYLYAEELPLAPPAHLVSRTLTIQDLQRMPDFWIMQLREAALVLDESRLHELIAAIPAPEQQLADTLKQLINCFDVEPILRLTQFAEG